MIPSGATVRVAPPVAVDVGAEAMVSIDVTQCRDVDSLAMHSVGAALDVIHVGAARSAALTEEARAWALDFTRRCVAGSVVGQADGLIDRASASNARPSTRSQTTNLRIESSRRNAGRQRSRTARVGRCGVEA